MKTKLILAAIALCATSTAAYAQTVAPPAPPLMPLTIEGDLERGAVLATTCAGCHGLQGYRNTYPAYHVPKLGGQNADYLEIALQGYRRGTRSHPTMQAQAASLSDQDIADVAAYLSSVEGDKQEGISGAAAVAIAAGKEKAAVCIACHGETGEAAAAQWPNLAGQHFSYLAQALRQYKHGGRNDMMMAPLVAALDDTAINEIAAYFAAQPGLYQTPEP